MDDHTSANRAAWDSAAKIHSRTYDIPRLLRGEPLLNELIRSEVGDVRGKSLIHLLCHIGTDTLSWALLGAEVTGVDISPEATRIAGELARQMNLDASFITSDVMDLESKLSRAYDIVFASTGVLCWVPDVEKFFRTVRGLLHPDGFFYLYDGHPFKNILEKAENGEPVVRMDYFTRGPWSYPDFVDYTEGNELIPTNTYEWTWTLGDIVTAASAAGMRIEYLHEFPQYIYNGYQAFDVQQEKVELYPCTFSLKAFAG